jgi:hypothetical protein
MAPFSRSQATALVRVVGTAIFILFAACTDAPIPLSSQRIDSPDAKRSAVVEELDNGLGFGLGALIHEIHVVGATDQVRTHGDASRSVVFYANTTEYKGPPITVKWLSRNRLHIAYGKALTPGKKELLLGEVTVEYVAQ